MSKYAPDQVIDLRSRTIDHQGPSHDAFEENFMKFAMGEEKKANAATPKSDVETEGSIETNVDKETSDTNRVGKNHEETKGMEARDALMLNGNVWGKQPPAETPQTGGGRNPHNEVLSTSAEEINVENNHDLLQRAFTQMAETSKTDKETVRKLFDNGQPGKYVTRAQTLLEKVRGTTGRS